MCSPTTCPNCRKTTWTGCGQHIDSVKASVPADQWCTCERDEKPSSFLGTVSSLFGR